MKLKGAVRKWRFQGKKWPHSKTHTHTLGSMTQWVHHFLQCYGQSLHPVRKSLQSVTCLCLSGPWTYEIISRYCGFLINKLAIIKHSISFMTIKWDNASTNVSSVRHTVNHSTDTVIFLSSLSLLGIYPCLAFIYRCILSEHIHTGKHSNLKSRVWCIFLKQTHTLTQTKK